MLIRAFRLARNLPRARLAGNPARSVQRMLLQRLGDAIVDQVGALVDRDVAAALLEFHPAHGVDLLAGDAALLPPLLFLVLLASFLVVFLGGEMGGGGGRS